MLNLAIAVLMTTRKIVSFETFTYFRETIKHSQNPNKTATSQIHKPNFRNINTHVVIVNLESLENKLILKIRGTKQKQTTGDIGGYLGVGKNQ